MLTLHLAWETSFSSGGWWLFPGRSELSQEWFFSGPSSTSLSVQSRHLLFLPPRIFSPFFRYQPPLFLYWCHSSPTLCAVLEGADSTFFPHAVFCPLAMVTWLRMGMWLSLGKWEVKREFFFFFEFLEKAALLFSLVPLTGGGLG